MTVVRRPDSVTLIAPPGEVAVLMAPELLALLVGLAGEAEQICPPDAAATRHRRRP